MHYIFDEIEKHNLKKWELAIIPAKYTHHGYISLFVSYLLLDLQRRCYKKYILIPIVEQQWLLLLELEDRSRDMTEYKLYKMVQKVYRACHCIIPFIYKVPL